MFSNSKNEQVVKKVNDNKVDTLIGTSTKLTGNIDSDGNIRVDGKYTGDIVSKKEVTIGEAGLVVGNITANNVIISGKMQGNIRCSGILEIISTGKLYGDIEADCISIKEGAVFKGKSIMNEEKETVDQSKVINIDDSTEIGMKCE